MKKEQHDLVALIALLREWLSGLGIRLEYTDSVDVFSSEMALAGKTHPHPMFDSGFFDFKENDSFGILAYMDGSCVGGIGAYFYDLGERTLAQHMSASYLRLYGTEHGVVTRHAPVIEHWINGPTIYLAELFLSKPPHGPRGVQGVSGAILLYIQAVAALFWRPNWIHAFVREEDGLRGKPLEYGFTTVVPFAQLWSNPPERRFSSEYFVANDLRQIQHLALGFSQDPETLHRFLRPDSSVTR